MVTKYSDKKVFEKHWGGGFTEIFDIDEYRVVVTYTTGSSVAVYAKGKLPLEEIKPKWEHMFWSYLPTKCLASGWWYMDETVDEAIDRNLDKIKHPDQRIWYEKVEYPKTDSPKVFLHQCNIRYEHGLTEERIKEIEASPNFSGWYKEDKWVTEFKEKHKPK